MKFSLKLNLVTFIIVMTLFFILIFTGIFYRDFSNHENNESINEAVESIDTRFVSLKDVQQQRILNIEHLLNIQEKMIINRSSDIENLFNQWKTKDDYMKRTYYIDENQNTYFSKSRLSEDQFYGDDKLIDKVNSEEVFYSKPYIETSTNDQIISFYKGIFVDDIYKGIIGLDVDLNYFIREIKQLESESIFGLALLSEGKIIYSDLDAEHLSYINSFNYNSDIEELDLYLKAETIQPLDVELAVFVKDIQMDLLTGRYVGSMIAVIIIYAILFVFLVMFALKELIDPIDRLKIFAFEIKGGNYNIQNKFYMEDDFSEIYNGFYRLGQYLKNNITMMSELRKSMDEKSIELSMKKTERQNAYKEIAVSQTKINQNLKTYQSIFDSLVDMIWEIDVTGKIINVNNNFLDRLGFIRNDIIGENIYDIVDSMLDKDEFLKVLKARDYKSIDINFISKYQSNITLRTSIYRIINSENEIVEIQALSVDDYYNYLRSNELSNRNRELTMLGEFSQEVLVDQTIDKLFDIIFEKIKLIITIDSTSIRMVNDDELVRMKSIHNNDDFTEYDTLKISESNSGHALQKVQLSIIDKAEDLTFPDEYLTHYIDNGGKLIFIPLYDENKAIGIISIASNEEIDRTKLGLIQNIADKAAIAINNRLIIEKLGKNYFNTVNTLKSILEAKNPKIYMHSLRVSEIAMFIAQKMYLKEKDVIDLGIAGVIHDIGIIGISDYLLDISYDEMTEIEKDHYGRHTEIGFDIISPLKYDVKILKAIQNHHNECERIKSDGYEYFERIICFSNWMDKMHHQFFVNGQLDNECFIKALKDNLKCTKCLDYVKIIERALDEESEKIIEILAMRNRGENLYESI